MNDHPSPPSTTGKCVLPRSGMGEEGPTHWNPLSASEGLGVKGVDTLLLLISTEPPNSTLNLLSSHMFLHERFDC